MKDLKEITNISQLEQIISEVMKYAATKTNKTKIKQLLSATIGTVCFYFPDNEKTFNTVLSCSYTKHVLIGDNGFKDAFDLMMEELNESEIENTKTNDKKPSSIALFICDNYSSFKSKSLLEQKNIISLSISTLKNYMNSNDLTYNYSLEVLHYIDYRSEKRSV